MMKPVSVFAGIAKSNTNKGIYSISIYYGGDVLSMPSRMVTSKGKITDTEIILEALKSAVKDISGSSKESVTIDFYGNSDSVRNTWNKYLATGIINAESPEKRLWEEVIALVKAKDVILNIKGKDNMLGKLNQMENRKARSDIKRKETPCR